MSRTEEPTEKRTQKLVESFVSQLPNNGNDFIGFDLVSYGSDGIYDRIIYFREGIPQQYLICTETQIGSSLFHAEEISYYKEDYTNVVGVDEEVRRVLSAAYTEKTEHLKSETRRYSKKPENCTEQEKTLLYCEWCARFIPFCDRYLFFNRNLYGSFVSMFVYLSNEITCQTRIASLNFVYEFVVGEIMKRLQHNLKQQATRAALTQVMARNMSHNLGSHVLVSVCGMMLDMLYNPDYIRKEQYINKSETTTMQTNKDSLKNRILELKTNIEDSNCLEHCQLIIDNFYDILEKNFKGGEKLKTLLNYIKIRMDYLADISTSIPVAEGSKKFQEIIDDGFVENKLLIDTISGIDSFKYKINCSKKEDSNKQLSIPNDVLGNHAFYTIFENLIRNSAKHGKSSDITFEIKIDDVAEANIPQKVKQVDETDEKYAVSIVIKDDGNIDDEVIDKLNEYINKSIIDKNTNALRQGGWGLLEMEASAAYLRKIPIEDIENDEFDVCGLEDTNNNPYLTKANKRLHIFKAYKETDGDKNYLAYRFFVNKPREILIIGKKEDIFENTDEFSTCREAEWLKNGIKIIDEIEDNKVYSHRLVVNYGAEITGAEKTKFSDRILNNPVKIKGEDKYGKIIQNFWGEYKSLNKFVEESNYIETTHSDATQVSEFLDKIKYSQYVCFPVSDTKQWLLKEESKNGERKICDFWKEDYKKNQLLLNAGSIVKIIDERIQKHALNYKRESRGKKVDFYTLYKYNNILIPVTNSYESDEYNSDKKVCVCDIKFDLNVQNFYGGNDKKIYESIIDYAKQEDNTEFLLIHLGIIEKVISSFNRDSKNNGKNNGKRYDNQKPEEIKTFIIEEIIKDSKITYDRVIVISGRGKPHNLPSDVRYLNFSIISQYLIEKQHKYPLMEAIYSARRLTN